MRNVSVFLITSQKEHIQTLQKLNTSFAHLSKQQNKINRKKKHDITVYFEQEPNLI